MREREELKIISGDIGLSRLWSVRVCAYTCTHECVLTFIYTDTDRHAVTSIAHPHSHMCTQM